MTSRTKMGDIRFLTMLRVVMERTEDEELRTCLLYTSPSPRDLSTSRMPSSA